MAEFGAGFHVFVSQNQAEPLPIGRRVSAAAGPWLEYHVSERYGVLGSIFATTPCSQTTALRRTRTGSPRSALSSSRFGNSLFHNR